MFCKAISRYCSGEIGKGTLGIVSVVVVLLVIFFAGFSFSFSEEDRGCSLFPPALNRPGVGEGGEKVNVDSLSLISIGGYLGFFGILYFIGGFPSFYYPYTLFPY